jgi:spoIIIJ-associated protein
MTTGLLNPHDRRIVHIALKDQQQLTTTSRGEGMLKKVVIIPNK